MLPAEISTADLAELLGISDRQVQLLAGEGVFQKVRHGWWPLTASVQAYVAYKIRTESERMQRLGAGTSTSRVSEARAREIELRIQREENRLVDTDRALTIVTDIIGIYRTGFGALPARVTRDLTLRRQIEDECNAIQGEVAGALERRSEALRRGDDALEAVAEDDA